MDGYPTNYKAKIDHDLVKIAIELRRANELKEQELKQQMFLMGLIEEVLPLDDNVKRSIHQRVIYNREW